MGTNLHDFYSQMQVQKLLGLPYRQQVKRWRAKFNPRYIVVCHRVFYYYRDIERYLNDLVVKGTLDRTRMLKMLIATPRYNIDLDEWAPLCLALERWPFSYELLYQTTKLRTGLPLVRTKNIFGLTFFNIGDMERLVEYNKGHGTITD